MSRKKIKNKTVFEILERFDELKNDEYSTWQVYKDIADGYNISTTTVYRIVNGTTKRYKELREKYENNKFDSTNSDNTIIFSEEEVIEIIEKTIDKVLEKVLEKLF